MSRPGPPVLEPTAEPQAVVSPEAAVKEAPVTRVYKVVNLPFRGVAFRTGAVCDFQLYLPGEWSKAKVKGLTCFLNLRAARNFAARTSPITEIWEASARGLRIRLPNYRLKQPPTEGEVEEFWRSQRRRAKRWLPGEMVHGWPHGTVMFPEIRLDRRIEGE